MTNLSSLSEIGDYLETCAFKLQDWHDADPSLGRDLLKTDPVLAEAARGIDPRDDFDGRRARVHARATAYMEGARALRLIEHLGDTLHFSRSPAASVYNGTLAKDVTLVIKTWLNHRDWTVDDLIKFYQYKAQEAAQNVEDYGPNVLAGVRRIWDAERVLKKSEDALLMLFVIRDDNPEAAKNEICLRGNPNEMIGDDKACAESRIQRFIAEWKKVHPSAEFPLGMFATRANGFDIK